jgi:hypothetical protein
MAMPFSQIAYIYLKRWSVGALEYWSVGKKEIDDKHQIDIITTPSLHFSTTSFF